MSSTMFSGMPGFRFHPTEQELVGYYLRRMVEGKGNAHDFIPMVELYRYEPWELREIASRTSEKELFFFVPRDSKFPNGGRPNRRTKTGYWKATGTDKQVQASVADPADCVGLKKTLVYYEGRAPNGKKTDWIMNEYRLAYGDGNPQTTKESLQSSITLCRIYRKDAPCRFGAAKHDVETEEEINGAYYTGSSKSFLQATTEPTLEFFELEDIDCQDFATSRQFPAIHESPVTPCPLNTQTSPSNCLSYTSNWPQSSPVAQNLAFVGQHFQARVAAQPSSGEITPSSSCFSNSFYSARGIVEHHVMENKASVLVCSDLGRSFDYTWVPTTDPYTDSHLDFQEIEL